MVTAGQKRGNHRDGLVGGQRAEHFAGRRTEHVDEGDVDLSVELLGNSLGQVTDHRDAGWLACAVGDQQ